jgi:hypothetical protein
MSNSWYVQSLIKGKQEIRQKIYTENSGTFEPSYTINYEDPDYLNLLLVETEIERMTKMQQFSDKESVILNLFLAGESLSSIEKSLSISRITVSKIFEDVCDRIAFMLGREFTDDGYLEYISEKYKLTQNQIEKARQYISSNKRHSVMKGGLK